MNLAADNLSAAGLAGPLYSGAGLEVGPGECVCIVGPTGSGKSTLLRTLAGLHEAGRDGRVLLGGRPVSDALPGRIGLVLQNPDTQLLCPDVGSELAFGLENLRVPPSEMTGRMLRALARVGLGDGTGALELDRPVANLSVGQKYKLLLAAMLVMPVLALVMDVTGLIGMGFVMALLGFPPTAVMNQLVQWMSLGDIVGGLGKAAMFGLAIGYIGCQAGLSAGRGPRAVGDAATAAVVGGIVALVVLDGIFAVLFFRLGW